MAEEVKMTATKAHVSSTAVGVSLLSLFFVGPHIGLPVPPVQDVTDALLAVLQAGAGAAIAWVGTYLPRNRPKEDDPAAVAQSNVFAGLVALGIVIMMMGCAAAVQVRQQALVPVLSAYHTAACPAGTDPLLVEALKAPERAAIYAETGVFIYSDCTWRPGDDVAGLIGRLAPQVPEVPVAEPGAE